MNIKLIKIYIITIFAFISFNTLADEYKKTLSLNEAIEIALSNNHDLQISKANIDIAKSRIKSAKSAYYPQIETKIVVPFVGRESGFFLDQLIWDFGRTSGIVKSRKSEFKASKHAFDKNTFDTIQNTKIAYYKVLIAKHNLIAAENKLEKNKISFTKIEELNKAGRSSNIELTKANSDLGSSELELLDSQNKYEISKLELMNLIGKNIDDNLDLEEDIKVNEINYDIDESVKIAIEESEELKNLEAKQASIQAKLSTSKSEFLPVIFGRTAYRFEGDGADDDGDDTPSFIAGIGVKFPIFLGFSRFAKLDESNAQFRRSQIEIEKLKHNIEKDVRKLYLQLSHARKRVSISNSSKNLSEKNLMLIKEKYNLGRASTVDLADAKASFSASNAEYFEAIYNYKITQTKFERIIGELQI